MNRYAAAYAALAALLCGCGSMSTARSLPFAVLTRVAPDGGHVPEILYIGDTDQDAVHSYNYKTGAHDGKLKFFSYPEGECVDAKGNVFIPSFGNRAVLEFRRGETHPMKTFKTSGSPVDCSVAPNGDLAVANRYTPSGIGDVDIFKRAKGKPTSYSDSACPMIAAAGYDGAGNLYVQRSTYSISSACELPAGSVQMRTVTLNVTIVEPAGVMWDGQNITMTDTEYNGRGTAIIRMEEDASGNLTAIGQTVLTKDACGRTARTYYPFVLGLVNTPRNTQLAVAVVGGTFGYFCDRTSIWKYPEGGMPKRSINTSSTHSVSGQSVSIAQ